MTSRGFLSLALGMASGFVFLALALADARTGNGADAFLWGLAGGTSLLSLGITALSARRHPPARCVRSSQDE